MKVLIEIDDKDYADIMSDSERNLNHYERLIKKGVPQITGHTECSCEQIKWERDTAIAQLKELGYGLGEKPKTGHWIDITNKNGTVIAIRCDCCENSPKHAIRSDFCPNCGAKMSEIPTDSESNVRQS